MKSQVSRLFLSLHRRINKVVDNFLRPILELLKIGHLSRPFAVGNRIGNRDFLETFDYKGGFFVEIGGFDGFLGSPTYYLEKIRGWRGILVEPIPDHFRTCQANRKSSTVIQSACVSFDYKEESVDLVIGSHSTRVRSISNATSDRNKWLKEFSEKLPEDTRFFKARALPLQVLLDEYFTVRLIVDIDLLVLDVEGFELQVLRGLDFKKYRPRNILVECQTSDVYNEVCEYLTVHKYEMSRKYSHHDYLFQDIISV